MNDLLGEGSLSKVYKGKHDIDGTIVAIKLIDKKITDKDDYY